MPTTKSKTAANKPTKDEIKRFNKTVATNVMFFRIERGWSQDDLVILSGIAKSNISRIENADYGRKINEDFIRILAGVFKVEPDAITETNAQLTERMQCLISVSRTWPVPPEIMEDAKGMLAVCDGRGPRERALAYMIMGHLSYESWSINQSIDYYDQAYIFALKTTDALLVQRTRYNLSMALVAIGRYDRAEQYMHRTLQEPATTESKIRSHQLLGSIYQRQNLFDRAEKSIRQATSLLDTQQGPHFLMAQCLQSLGVVSARKGEFSAAVTFINAAIELGQKTSDDLTVIYGLKVLGDLYCDSGNQVEGNEAFYRALEISERLGRETETNMLRFFIAYHGSDYPTLKKILEQQVKRNVSPHQLIDQYDKTAETAEKLGYYKDAVEYIRQVNKMIRGI